MKYKYALPAALVEKAASLEEFANGATQVTVRMKDGRTFGGVLLSASQYIVAMRGHLDLPFDPEQVTDVFQKLEDRAPRERGGWHYWDEWEARR